MIIYTIPNWAFHPVEPVGSKEQDHLFLELDSILAAPVRDVSCKQIIFNSNALDLWKSKTDQAEKRTFHSTLETLEYGHSLLADAGTKW